MRSHYQTTIISFCSCVQSVSISLCSYFIFFVLFFFFNDTATTEIYTLSLHDALPILSKHLAHNLGNLLLLGKIGVFKQQQVRSEERFSRNAETDLVCRLLLEKKKIKSASKNRI